MCTNNETDTIEKLRLATVSCEAVENIALLKLYIPYFIFYKSSELHAPLKLTSIKYTR